MSSARVLAERQERESRRARERLRRALPPVMRAAARGSGWQAAKGVLFRELNGWFLDVAVAVHVDAPRVVATLRAKPMEIDPLFWDITGLRDNNQQPLSFRKWGAFTCWTPPYLEAELVNSDHAPEIADATVRWAGQTNSAFDPADARSVLIDRLTSGRLKGGFAATYACLMILQDRTEEARTYCEEQRLLGETGGFTNVDLAGATFFDAAIRWLDVKTSS